MRCVLTFLGELVQAGDVEGKTWSVERRFRVTEVFLALLWVRMIYLAVLGRTKAFRSDIDASAYIMYL